MARRKREPWKPDIIGVLVCAFVFSLFQGTPFTADPLNFVMFCGFAGGLVGYLQIRPEKRKRLIRWIHTWFSIPGMLISSLIALSLPLSGIWYFVFVLAIGAVVRFLRHPQDESKRIARIVRAWFRGRID